MQPPLVTAIVSTYNAERFIGGCIEDLINQTIFEKMEVLVIDSGSQENESAICQKYANTHPQIKIIRTEREPLYAAWNRAISLAKGKYLTSANADDRHRSDYCEVMTNALIARPQAALAYAGQYFSETENETFEQCKSRDANEKNHPEYSVSELIMGCFTGSQPMWRRDIHSELGLFDTEYKIAADWEMWLRFAAKHQIIRMPDTLGVIFFASNTISGSSNQIQLDIENLSIQKSCMRQPNWRNLPGLTKKLSEVHFWRGYKKIQDFKDNRGAEPFIREAINLDPMNIKYIKTYILRCLLGYSR